jgi:hypothetical protein
LANAQILLEEQVNPGFVPPNVGTKGEANGGMTGPENRKCTPYLGSGPGSTPLDLPLSDGLGGAGLVGDADQLYENCEHAGTKK